MALVSGLLPIARLEAAGYAASDNFTVFTKDTLSSQASQQLARAVLAKAESYRQQIAVEWFGQALPPGAGRTTIHVSLGDQRDRGLTWVKDDPRRRFHTIYLSTSEDGVLGGTLRHEIAHTVLATQYPHPDPLPAWLDEGIASRYDDADRLAIRQQILDWFVRSGNWPRLETLLTADTIDAADKPTYAAAASLTEFLLTRADRATLLEFGAHCRTDPLDLALSRFYRLPRIEQLQAEWQDWVSQGKHE
jgi:hypothetical protein